MTTPAEKDAMALAVLLRAAGIVPSYELSTELTEARAHLAARVAEQAEEIRALKAEVKGLSQSLTDAIDQHEDAKVDAKFIREAYFKAEAELAAVRDALDTARDYVASALTHEREAFKGYEHCSDIDTIEADLASIDAARGAG